MRLEQLDVSLVDQCPTPVLRLSISRVHHKQTVHINVIRAKRAADQWRPIAHYG